MLGFILALFPLLVILPEFIKIGLNTFTISSILIGLLLGLRIIYSKPILTSFYLKIYSLITSVIVILAVASLAITVFTYQNFIYSKIFIHVEVLGYLVAAAIATLFIQLSDDFFEKNIKKIFFVSPLIYSAVIGLLFMLPNNLLFNLSIEDSFIENLQFISLLIGGVGGVFIGLKLLKTHKLFAFTFLVISSSLLVVAGEEISWGQRVFDFGNESLQSINIQNETNVHNIKGVHFGIPIVYSIIGLFGSLGALLVNSLKLFSNDFRKYLVPGNYFFFFFFIPFLYNILTLKYGPLTEASELLLYAGVSLFLIQTRLTKDIN